MQRTIPYYVDKIVPDSIAQGKNVLIASSENAIRGLLMHLCEVSGTVSSNQAEIVFRSERFASLPYHVLPFSIAV